VNADHPPLWARPRVVPFGDLALLTTWLADALRAADSELRLAEPMA